jgi:RND superfamily putative drug exporter
LIRTVILPSALTLLGEHSWYLPRWLKWLPHLEIESAEAPTIAPVSVPATSA